MIGFVVGLVVALLAYGYHTVERWWPDEITIRF